MKNKSVLLCLIILISTLLIFAGKSYAADSAKIPTASNNIKISAIRKSSLVSLDTGYMRVFYDNISKNIGIEYYDNNFNITSKKKISLELDIWGGFYAGKDAYYIVEGKNNLEEDNNAEVIRVIKYDKNWKRIGASQITSDASDSYKKVRYPFDVGCVEMTEVNGNLYVVTGHQGYVDKAVGQGHQGFLMVKVDESTLKGEIVKADLWHSFAQFIDYKDSNLYVLEQSEGSGYTKLTKYDENKLSKTAIPVLRYGGDRSGTWAKPCYASVDGMEIASENVLCVGTSIDQSQYDSVKSTTAHNVYLTVTPINNFTESATTVKWLTNLSGNGQAFKGLEIKKINDNRFIIFWEELDESQEMKDKDILTTNILHYVFVDGSGNKLGKEYTAPATISDCKPIVKGSKIIYYASSENMVDFYTIDSNTGKFDKVVYRVAGENAKWDLDDNGVLTISGTGDITVSPTVQFRYPLSSTKSFSYDNSANAWKSIKNLANEIVIKEGITSVPEKEFRSFPLVTQVILPKSMVSIGKEAFADCAKLRKVVMLSNVNEIGDNAVWSGYYNWSYKPLNYATIYTTKGSYADTWGEKNNVSRQYIEELKLEDSATGTTLKALGESTVTLQVNKLEEGNTDYKNMKSKVSDKIVIEALEVTTNGMCIGEKDLTFTVGADLKGKNITLVQKKSDGTMETSTKKVDNNGKVNITTDKLSSYMIAINASDVDYTLGDVNRDGYIDITDCLQVLLYVKGRSTLTFTQKLAADVNKDGYLDILDCSRILLYVKGRIASL